MTTELETDTFDGFTVKRPSNMVNVFKIQMATPRVKSSRAVIFEGSPDFPYVINARTGNPSIGLDEENVENIEIASSTNPDEVIVGIYIPWDEDANLYVRYNTEVISLDDLYGVLYHLSNELELGSPA